MRADERQTLIDQYRGGYDAVVAALDGATAADLDARPAPDEWTAREVVHHLADAETMASTRLRRLLAEDDAVIQAYDENQFARTLHYDRPLDASLAVIKAVRDANVDLLAHLDDASWGRVGTHTESGAYGVETWLEIYAAHPYDHADQIRKASRAPRSVGNFGAM